MNSEPYYSYPPNPTLILIIKMFRKKVKVKSLICVRLFVTPQRWSLPGSSVCGIFPGKNTGVGCHFLLQGTFLTQGLNPGLPHCRQTRYGLSHQRSPKCLRSLLKKNKPKKVITERVKFTGNLIIRNFTEIGSYYNVLIYNQSRQFFIIMILFFGYFLAIYI